MKILVLLCALIGLSGCVSTSRTIDWSMELYDAENPTKESFVHCSATGCNSRQVMSFEPEEWASIKAIFVRGSMPTTPQEERFAIQLAIGQMETIVGKKNKTEADVGGSFGGAFKNYQLDCIDEMMDAAIYAQILMHEGLVKFHEPGDRLINHFFKNGSGWPHNASTIREIETGDEWAIDSWWLKNGMPPYIITRDQWQNGKWVRPKSGRAKKAAEAEWTKRLAELAAQS